MPKHRDHHERGDGHAGHEGHHGDHGARGLSGNRVLESFLGTLGAMLFVAVIVGPAMQAKRTRRWRRR